MLRVKTVVGSTDTAFQNHLEPQGYVWRFNAQSPGGHLFDRHSSTSTSTSLWLFDQDIKSVQAVVRQAPALLRSPDRGDLGVRAPRPCSA